MLLEVFVEGILSERESRASSESTAAIVDEVKGLFEKLATDIPTQMARGMETAFRDLVPRLGRASASSPDPGQAAAARTGAPKIALVRKEAGPREVQSYRSRRRKSKRVKL